MSHPLIARNADLKQLQDDGYEIEILGSYLLVRSVPYRNSKGEVCRGVLICDLHLNVDVTIPPTAHVVKFTGDFPHDQDGTPIAKLRHSDLNQEITDGVVAKFSFSNKPKDGYTNHYHLVTTYVANISGPAELLDPSATARTWHVPENNDPDSVFKYPDTASSRAGIVAISQKLAMDSIAIVGLGGTGSYVLDLLAKTRVKNIHLFDGDRFGSHNAFRAPGAPTLDQLRLMQMKVDHFAQIYSNMRTGIVPHAYSIDATNVDELALMNFVFLCMDNGPAKRGIVEKLEELNVPFVDVGMGVHISGANNLFGVMTVTMNTPAKRDHFRSRVSFAKDADNAYSQNIQIADLNAMNAALAVMRWKKFCGFYSDLENEHYTAFTIDGNALLNEDKLAKDENTQE